MYTNLGLCWLEQTTSACAPVTAPMPLALRTAISPASRRAGCVMMATLQYMDTWIRYMDTIHGVTLHGVAFVRTVCCWHLFLRLTFCAARTHRSTHPPPLPPATRACVVCAAACTTGQGGVPCNNGAGTGIAGTWACAPHPLQHPNHRQPRNRRARVLSVAAASKTRDMTQQDKAGAAARSGTDTTK